MESEAARPVAGRESLIVGATKRTPNAVANASEAVEFKSARRRVRWCRLGKEVSSESLDEGCRTEHIIMFDSRVLFAAPMLMLGGTLFVVMLTVLGLTRNIKRVLAGAIGGIAGYVILGTALAERFYDQAIAAHTCPDAEWGGPAAGELCGIAVAVLGFELWRLLRRRPTVDPRTA